MQRKLISLSPVFLVAVVLVSSATSETPSTVSKTAWTFAVSGDSRNCGDFVMPAIATHVRAEGDAFYWHLGDFRAIYKQDEDFVSMEPATFTPPLSLAEYDEVAWDDFLVHQMAPFGDFPVFVGRGNHETIAPMTRDRYIAKFSSFLNRAEVVLQNRSDSAVGSPSPLSSPWYHFVRNGVDFITLDNASTEEFTDAQLTWLRGVLKRDLDPKSGITTIIGGMHEALPHSTSSGHSMDDWYKGTTTGETVYRWFANAQKSGKHVYLLASHSHFYSPDVYDTEFWQKEDIVLPGIIIGSAGAQRYLLPDTASKDSLTHIYGYLQATVEADGQVKFVLHQISEEEMLAHKWPQAPDAVVHECFIHNAQVPAAAAKP